MNPFIFRAYDIRGVAGVDLTPEVARLIGQGYGTLLRQEQQRITGNHTEAPLTIALGQDVRVSSPELHNACVEGLLSVGCNVVDIGITLTPMMYFSVVHYKLDGGINITGSHNPKNENGFKLARYPFDSVHGDDIQKIHSIIEQEDFFVPNEPGRVIQKDIIADYLHETGARAKKKKDFRMIIDCGNGTAGLYAPQLYRLMGYDVEELYCDIDGDFPHHLPDPQDHNNMKDLAKAVVERGADIGLAFDGDGDRVGMVDRYGKSYDGDIVMVILAAAAARQHPECAIVVDVKSSKALLDMIEQYGGKPVLGKTGPPNHKQAMKDLEAPLAGEISGHYFISDGHWGFDDGLFAGLRILQELGESKKSLDEYLAVAPVYNATPEIKIACPDDKKFQIVKAVTDALEKDYSAFTEDGVRATISDVAWLLIRASNTTPNITVRCEGKTEVDKEQAIVIAQQELQKAFASEGIPFNWEIK